MTEGAFAFMDCLGFKGAWSRVTDSSMLANKMRSIEQKVTEARAQAARFIEILAGSNIHCPAGESLKLQVQALTGR